MSTSIHVHSLWSPSIEWKYSAGHKKTVIRIPGWSQSRPLGRRNWCQWGWRKGWSRFHLKMSIFGKRWSLPCFHLHTGELWNPLEISELPSWTWRFGSWHSCSDKKMMINLGHLDVFWVHNIHSPCGQRGKFLLTPWIKVLKVEASNKRFYFIYWI